MSVSQCQCVSVSVAVAKSMNTSVISRRRPLSHIDININIKNKMANVYPVVDAAVPEVKVEIQDKLHKGSCTYYVITFGGPERPPPM